MRFKISCWRCENANSASLSQWRKHFFLQIQMLIFRPERPDRSAEKFSDIAERLFLIVCWKQAFLLKRANLKMHKVLCCQQWPRGLKARAVDSKAIACYDIPTNYPTMLICGLLQINMPALSDARQGGKAGSGRGFSPAWTTLTCADNYNSWTAPRLPTMLIEPAHIQQTGVTIQGSTGVYLTNMGSIQNIGIED